MLLFVGLGNPGSKYENNRHNVGFMAVDEIVRRHNFLPEKKRWQALTSDGRLGPEKIIVIKPQTYMNESGRSIGEAMRFFKLSPADVIVFYDEIDLAFGKVKVKNGGGAAGHNGIRSITSHIGADFTRVRIGVGHPGDKSRVHNHVLGDFAKAEGADVEKMLDAIAKEVPHLADRDTPKFLTSLALHLSPQRPNSDPKKAGTKQKNKQDTAPGKDTGPKTVKISAAPLKHEQKKEGPLAAALRALKFGDK
ncbi:MAG: aminoacyl-tRNA hydrolase [Kordiimonadales bacterium]|nr:MAG: aminoacyl-tRNA hydrolase [Kordiimonadales bacterium]